eukprot:s1431_g11.t3
MAKRRKSNDGAAVTVSLLLLLTCVSCALIIVLHNNGLVDQVAMAFPHRLAERDGGPAASKRKGLSAIIAVPGGRLAPSPCGENGVLLHKTVEALLESSGDVLTEIIVVEDGTLPAIPRPDLTGMAWTELQIPRQEAAGADLFQGVQLLWLRLSSPQGTAAARTAGGEAARGEALAFFDCYVRPQTGWAEPIMKLLRKHPKSVAVPALMDLDANSWETSGPPRFFDNLFTWEAETVQLYFDKERVTWPHPIDQSNVLVFSWSCCQEIGGYDSMMKGSSTLLIENIELSLRVLLCGGKFVPMNDSVVGFCHQQHGTLHHERRDMLFNQARAIHAWFGPWSSEALKNPRFDRDLRETSAVSELSDVRAVQEPSGRVVLFHSLSHLCLKYTGEKCSVDLMHSLVPHAALPDYRFRGMHLKMSAVHVGFDDVGVKLKNGKCILEGVTGEFRPKKVAAIMGPSGAGKTTFMNALCGRCYYGTTSGEIRINGQVSSIAEIKNFRGFVPQDDIVHEHLTVREQLYYSARLRNAEDTSRKVIEYIVEDVLNVMQLVDVQHSLVGNVERRGISGGQRKRVNIGLELAARPSILMLDEPTSGS